MRCRLAFARFLAVAVLAMGCGEASWQAATGAGGSGGRGGAGGSGTDASGNAATSGSGGSGNAAAAGSAGSAAAGAGGSAGNGSAGATGSGGIGSGATTGSAGVSATAGRGGGSGSTGSGGRGSGGYGGRGGGGGYGGRGGGGGYGGRGGGGAGGASGGGGQLAASYVGCSTVGGIDRVVIGKRDPVRDLCFNLVLDSPGQAPAPGLTLPPGFGLEHASVGPSSPCPTRFAPLQATQVTGNVDLGGGGSGGLPSRVTVDVTFGFPSNDAGAPTSERLAAQNVDVQMSCP